MRFIKAILRFFFKFTGFLPLFLLLRQRYYKDNVKKKSRAIKGKDRCRGNNKLPNRSGRVRAPKGRA